jgi:Na+/proline symporter
MSNQLLNFASTDWRGVHYGTYLLLRVLELIFWISGAIGGVAAVFSALHSEKLTNGKTSRPDLGLGIANVVAILILTLILVIAVRLLAAFTLRRSIDGFEELLED